MDIQCNFNTPREPTSKAQILTSSPSTPIRKNSDAYRRYMTLKFRCSIKEHCIGSFLSEEDPLLLQAAENTFTQPYLFLCPRQTSSHSLSLQSSSFFHTHSLVGVLCKPGLALLVDQQDKLDGHIAKYRCGACFDPRQTRWNPLLGGFEPFLKRPGSAKGSAMRQLALSKPSALVHGHLSETQTSQLEVLRQVATHSDLHC